jgi:CRISPR/Cas system-associated exonuclease Cas4 (RecB family)
MIPKLEANAHFTHVASSVEAYYLICPQQLWLPDETFKANTKGLLV